MALCCGVLFFLLVVIAIVFFLLLNRMKSGLIEKVKKLIETETDATTIAEPLSAPPPPPPPIELTEPSAPLLTQQPQPVSHLSFATNGILPPRIFSCPDPNECTYLTVCSVEVCSHLVDLTIDTDRNVSSFLDVFYIKLPKSLVTFIVDRRRYKTEQYGQIGECISDDAHYINGYILKYPTLNKYFVYLNNMKFKSNEHPMKTFNDTLKLTLDDDLCKADERLTPLEPLQSTAPPPPYAPTTVPHRPEYINITRKINNPLKRIF